MSDRRANPEQLLTSILSSPDRATALGRLTAGLGRTWESGHRAGWAAGMADATDDEPTPRKPNPYDRLLRRK